MSRKGNYLDNSVMKNFFGRLKVVMFYGKKFQTVAEFVHCLKEYINYWNNERISHSKRNESATVQNSFTSYLVIPLSNFWGAFHLVRLFLCYIMILFKNF